MPQFRGRLPGNRKTEGADAGGEILSRFLLHLTRRDGDKVPIFLTCGFLSYIVEVFVREYYENIRFLRERIKVRLGYDGDVRAGTKTVLLQRTVVNEEFNKVGTDVSVIADG